MDITRNIAIMAATDALSNVGVTEVGGDNKGPAVKKYLESCGLAEGYPWCAAFLVYRYRRAAHKLGLPITESWPRSAYCPDYSRWAKTNGLWIPYLSASLSPSSVRVGDMALFYFKQLNRIAHCGIVVDVHHWGVTTVEGNTNQIPTNITEVEREGDIVASKSRRWSDLGLYGGFAQINF